MQNKAVLENPSSQFLVLSSGIDDTIRKDLEGIVQDSFGKPVSGDYIPYLIQNNAHVYFVHNEMNEIIGAAVVIEKPAEGMPPHLVTLAVPSHKQRQGIGKDIMAELLKYYPKLNWRSKPDREPAKMLYQGIIQGIVGETSPFTAVDGLSYSGYFVNHTTKEKQKAITYMAAQPSHFKI